MATRPIPDGGPTAIQSNTAASWNGSVLGRNCNRIAVQWAWEQGPRLKEIGLNRGERDVLLALAYYTGLDGSNWTWPSHESIKKQTCMTVRAVIDSLRRLENAKVIRRVRDRGKHNVYQILPEVDSHRWIGTTREVSALVQPLHGTSELAAPQLVKPLHTNKSNEQEQVTRVGGARKRASTPRPPTRRKLEESKAAEILAKCGVVGKKFIGPTVAALKVLSEKKGFERAAYLLELRLREGLENVALHGIPRGLPFWFEDQHWKRPSSEETRQAFEKIRPPQA